MRTTMRSMLVGALFLAACQAQTTNATHKVATRASGATTSSASSAGPTPTGPLAASTQATDNQPSVAPKASPSNSVVSASVQPSLGAGTVAKLLAPTGPVSTLSGQIKIDASYVVGTGGGTIISNNGSAVLAVGGNILANNGSGLIANNAGNVLASGDGNVIPGSGSGIAATAGGQIHASASGSIFAAGDGIISENGAGVVSNNGSGYRLLQQASATAAAAVPTTARDALLPGVGMLVSAVSMHTHAYLPLGVDASGKAVYAVYSDAQGGYKLYLPKSEEGNVLVIATVPGTRDEDLLYSTVTPVTANLPSAIDEDTYLATRLFRFSIAGQVAAILTTPSIADTVVALGEEQSDVGGTFQTVLTPLVTAINNRARAKGVPNGATMRDTPQVQELALAITDQALSNLDYDSLQLTPIFSPKWDGPPEQAYEAFGAIVKSMRGSTEAYVQKQLALGASLPLTIPFNLQIQTLAGPSAPVCGYTARLKVSKPSDLGAFIVNDILARDHNNGFYNTRLTLAGLALTPLATPEDFNLANPNVYADPSGKLHQVDKRIQAAFNSILGRFALLLVPPGSQAGDPPSPALAGVLAAIDSYAATHTFSTQVAPVHYLGGPPCQPTPRP